MTEEKIRRGVYVHSKTGRFYQVVGESRDSETFEWRVKYLALYDDPARDIKKGDEFSRPLKNFLEIVIVGNEGVPRYRFVG